MKTLVDTSAIIALRNPEEERNLEASDLLNEARSRGAIVVAPVTYTEIGTGPAFESQDELEAFFDDTGIRVENPTRKALFTASEAFRTYLDRRGKELQCSHCGYETIFDCPDCGASVTARRHVPADFLIGAQATEQAEKLLTFDRGLFETYFEVDILAT